MPFVRCPACDEEMEIEPEWYGRKVACPSCDKRFVARRPGAAEEDEDEPDARPRRRSRAWEEDDEDDDRPRRNTKRRTERPLPMSRGTRQLILAVAIAGPILLMCLGCGGWAAFAVFGPVNYPEPWVTQALPDGSASMRFPNAPTPESLGDPLIADVGTKYSYVEPLPKDAAFAFGAVDFPFDRPGLLDEIYRKELDDLKRTTRCRIARESTVGVSGYTCKEAELNFGGGASGRYRMVYVPRRPGPRLIIVFVGGRNVSKADQQKYLDSLQFTGR